MGLNDDTRGIGEEPGPATWTQLIGRLDSLDNRGLSKLLAGCIAVTAARQGRTETSLLQALAAAAVTHSAADAIALHARRN